MNGCPDLLPYLKWTTTTVRGVRIGRETRYLCGVALTRPVSGGKKSGRSPLRGVAETVLENDAIDVGDNCADYTVFIQERVVCLQGFATRTTTTAAAAAKRAAPVSLCPLSLHSSVLFECDLWR